MPNQQEQYPCADSRKLAKEAAGRVRKMLSNQRMMNVPPRKSSVKPTKKKKHGSVEPANI